MDTIRMGGTNTTQYKYNTRTDYWQVLLLKNKKGNQNNLTTGEKKGW